MKKSIINLGKVLYKAEQKLIEGGFVPRNCTDSNNVCNGNHECPKGQGCFIESDDFPIVAVCKCLN